MQTDMQSVNFKSDIRKHIWNFQHKNDLIFYYSVFMCMWPGGVVDGVESRGFDSRPRAFR